MQPGIGHRGGLAAAFFASMTIAACGVRAANAATASDAPCSITLTGAKAGAFACADDRTAMYGIKEKTTMVGFTSNDDAPTVAIAIKVAGMPTAKSYRSSDAGAAQGISVRNGNKVWTAQGGMGDHPQGTYLLTLTAVKEVPFATDVKGYEVHGTLTATLQPDTDTGATGTVTLKAVF